MIIGSSSVKVVAGVTVTEGVTPTAVVAEAVGEGVTLTAVVGDGKGRVVRDAVGEDAGPSLLAWQLERSSRENMATVQISTTTAIFRFGMFFASLILWS